MRTSVLVSLALASITAKAQDPIPGLEDPFPHLGIETISSQISKLGDSSLIPAVLVPQLQRPLTASLEGLESANPKLAIQHLDVFKNKLSAQVAPDIGDGLAAQATSVQGQIGEMASREVIAATGPCVVPEPSEFQSLSVGPGEELTTILDALAFAAAQGMNAVELVLAPVAYREGSITIQRHTRFVSPEGSARIVGGIVNNGPYLLELEDVILSGSMGAGAAIFADNQCAVTNLDNVEIEFADGSGIRQQGGALTADQLAVLFSSAPDFPLPTDRDVGRGLRLSDGVRACMTDITVDGNESGILLAEGFMTRVFVSRLFARGNEVNPIVAEELFVADPNFVPSSGSIEVRNEALVLGELIRVSSSEVFGLVVDDNAQAHMRYTTIERAESIRQGSRSLGGSNVLALNGILELNGIHLQHAPIAGLIVDSKGGALVTASGTSLSNNEIGVGLFVNSSEEGTCAVECLGEVAYRHNGRNLDADFVPIPCDPVLGCPPCPVCPSVPYSPVWCTE